MLAIEPESSLYTQEKLDPNYIQDLQRLFEEEEFTDVTFVVEGKRVRAHRHILSARCDRFKAMFASGLLESQHSAVIPIEELSYPVFRALLLFCYTSKFVLPSATLPTAEDPPNPTNSTSSSNSNHTGSGSVQKPKRALTAYLLFSQEKRDSVKSANPNATFGELGKLLGQAWKDLPDSEKQKYNEKAAQGKIKYQKGLAKYKEEHPESSDEELAEYAEEQPESSDDSDKVQQVLDLLQAAEGFLLDKLKYLCEMELATKYVTVDTAVTLCQVGDYYRAHFLKKRAMETILANFDELHATEEFASLDSSLLYELLMRACNKTPPNEPDVTQTAPSGRLFINAPSIGVSGAPWDPESMIRSNGASSSSSFRWGTATAVASAPPPPFGTLRAPTATTATPLKPFTFSTRGRR